MTCLTSTTGQLTSLRDTGMVNCDQSQKVETSYCCAAINGTLTQDGVNDICDCDANQGSTQPLHFQSNASAITTIDEVPSSSQSSVSTTTALTKTSSFTQSSFLVSTAPASTISAKSTYFSTPTHTSLTTSPSLSRSSNKRADAIGAGIGAALALIVLGFVAFFLYRKISHPGQEKESHETGLSPRRNTPIQPSPSYLQQYVGPSEFLASTGAHEMPAAPGCYELPSNNVIRE